jgi:PAS domain S-box-containing protein
MSMARAYKKTSWVFFIVSIILPTVLAIAILLGSTYLFIIPIFKEIFLDSKRDMIRELVNVSWSIMVLYEREEQAGRLSRSEAQRKAVEEIEHLRYGNEFRDYFWISDLQPKLIMHPYSKEMVGSDLSSFEGVGGKKIFMDIIETVSTSESGYIDYIWNRKYQTAQNVPKLSYVKKFEPWGWVIGTGVFLDDLEEKMTTITRRLSRMIYLTLFFISILLTLVALRSLIIENKRRRAEADLRRSRIKYKTLVESAVEPVMMIHAGQCIYANSSMEDLSGYSAAELESIDLTELFEVVKAEAAKSADQILSQVLRGAQVAGEHEALLRRPDGQQTQVLLSLSSKDLGLDKVIVATVRDLSTARRMEEELDESRERYRLLTNRLSIGVFRTTPGPRFKILEANPFAVALLAGGDERQIIDTELFDYLEEDKDAPPLSASFDVDGIAREQVFRVKQSGDRPRIVSVSMVLSHDSEGNPRHCDSIIEDVSSRQKTAEERENLIVELQTSLMFLNQPVKNGLTGYISCDYDTPVGIAAQIMSEARKSAILISREQTMVGIVTDLLLRERVLAENLAPDTKVGEVMSTPLIFIEDTALIFEAVMLLQEHDIKHLVVRDEHDMVVSIISNEELLDVHRYSSTFMIEQIRNAKSVEEIVQSHHRLPRIIKALTDSGAHARNINRIITRVSDTVLERLIDLAIEEIGEPPTRFAFVSVGSEGRGEQTLVTDQDNAIIFEDVDEQASESVQAYFNRFGSMVCSWLDEVGYRFCSGEIMAMNPAWCQPFSRWKAYFTEWINESSPETLMEVSIFFDFRCLYGDRQFTDALHEHIKSRAQNQKAFLYQMAQNTLLFKVPIDFFGKLSVESGGEHHNTFNIKHAMAQVVGFARVYAIYYGLECTNTLQRINRLHEIKVLKSAVHQEIVESYNYLMQLRLKHQVRRLDTGHEPDNHVNANELSHMEKDLLEKIFGQINQLRKRLSLVGHNEIYF